MSPYTAATPRAESPAARRFPDRHGRAWEVIAAPYSSPDARAGVYRLYFRSSAHAGSSWVPGPLVTAVRFSDERLARLLEKTLTPARRPAVAADGVPPSASARAGEWLPDFDDHFELVLDG